MCETQTINGPAKGQKTHTLHQDGYRTLWWNGPKGSREINVNVYDTDNKLVLEWTFPQVAGTSLIGNTAVFLDQAIIYAKNPPK